MLGNPPPGPNVNVLPRNPNENGAAVTSAPTPVIIGAADAGAADMARLMTKLTPDNLTPIFMMLSPGQSFPDKIR